MPVYIMNTRHHTQDNPIKSPYMQQEFQRNFRRCAYFYCESRESSQKPQSPMMSAVTHHGTWSFVPKLQYGLRCCSK